MENLSHLQQPISDDEEDDVDGILNEAEKYLSLPDEPMGTDILVWWAAHESTFPRLSLMARQYLGCPATSASAERLFSIAGRAFDDLRQAMDDKILEMLMWARVNRETRVQRRTPSPWSFKTHNPCTPAPSNCGSASGSSITKSKGKQIAGGQGVVQ